MSDAAGTVHVIDDDEETLDSVRVFLEAHWIHVRAYGSAESFLAVAAPEPGCVLVDLRMPGMSGLDLLRRLGTDAPELPAIVLSGHGDMPVAIEAMKLGARDFLTKPYDPRQLLQVVQEAVVVGVESAARIDRQRELRTALQALTQRERDVLRGLVAGQSSREIAKSYGLQPKSVEVYRSRVLAKLGFGSSLELTSTVLSTFPDVSDVLDKL